jgi:hypothetical protein
MWGSSAMGGLELAKMADFCADLTSRFALTDSLALWRDISERLHRLATEPEEVTYREATANGVPALWVIPAGSSSEHGLLHSHSGGSVVASMWRGMAAPRAPPHRRPRPAAHRPGPVRGDGRPVVRRPGPAGTDTFAPACLHGVWWSCTEPRPLMETQPPAGPGERSGSAAAGEAGNGGDLLN